MSIVPGQNDVLIGRGCFTRNHSGNVQYRSIVDSHYLKATKLKKRIIATLIVENIRSMDPPGRFLMVDSNSHSKGRNKSNNSYHNNLWVIVDNEQAITKTAHCLREKKKIKKEEEEEEEEEEKTHEGAVHEKNDTTLQQHMAERQHIYRINPVSISVTDVSSPVNSSAEYVNDNTYFPLREWANHALNSVEIPFLGNESYYSSFGADLTSWPSDVKRSLALSSDAYLTSALKIAHSLADQICKAEELLARISEPQRDGCINIEKDVPFLPSPGCNWADRVVVHLSASLYNSCDLEPIPFSFNKPASSNQHELQAIIKSIIPEKRDHQNRECCEMKSQTSIDPFFLSVSKAQFMPPLKYDEQNVHLQDQAQRIYSLGLVFYYLFSGGKNPPKLEQNLDSIIRAGNFASALEIMDELGSDEEFFGDPKNQNSEESQNRRKKGRSQHSARASKQIYPASVEPLKMQGLPVPLCDLITNMLDCANGDFCGDETYRKMTDVRSDLQLMLDKPSQFLRNIDFDNLSITGLKLHSMMFGRDDEFSTLQGCYRRSTAHEHEFAIISGTSGTGKTALAERFGKFVTDTGGIFLSGKFDQLPQADPFSAIAFAFDEYCKMLVIDGEPTRAATVASKLRAALGKYAHYLVKVIPNLFMILGHVDENAIAHDCVDAQERLQYLLCQFVEVISSTDTPVTLFLDDLQWADPASIKLVNSLLLGSGSSSQSKGIFFLGSCREGESSRDHPVWKMISSVRHLGVCATIINISCMDKDAVNAMVSDLLCISPRLTRTLSEIVYHKTKGNPLFFSRLILSLSKEGLLRLSLSRRRWEWDEEKIQSRKLPDDVAMFLTSDIGRLPKEVQSALCVLSCFGASSSIILIQTLERILDVQLLWSLEVAAEEGLLDKLDRNYRFCHDRVQEAVYNMMEPEERCLLHFRYGLALCKIIIGNGNEHDDLLFVAVNQVNRGGPSAIEDAEQGFLIGRLNLRAGNKAIEMSDFASALSFFENGISFLPSNHWQINYDLSLELFEKAAQSSFAIGENVKHHNFSVQVLTFAQSFEDKLNIMHLNVSALCSASMLKEAIESGTLILSQIGEDLPENIPESEINTRIEQTQARLLKIPHEDLMNYRPMTITSKIMAMKVLTVLIHAMALKSHDSFPLVVLRMLHLSLDHGFGSMSAIGFVYFGRLLAKNGNIQEGYRFVKFAKKLTGRFGSKDVAGFVTSLATQVIVCVEPMQSTLEYNLQGYTDSMESGDLRAAILNYGFYCVFLHNSGAALATTKEKIDNGCRLMKHHGILNILECILPLARSVSMLIGAENDQTENLLTDQTSPSQNTLAAMFYYFNQTYTSLMFRKHDDMKRFAEKYFEFTVHAKHMQGFYSNQFFIIGLVSFWIFRQSDDSKWAERGSQFKSAMGDWAESSRWNFLQKFYLMQAEEQFCNKQFECAKSSYDKAIASAREHKFINDEALACELAGYFYLEIGNKVVSVEYFARAHKKYHEWGAFAKANKVDEFIQNIVASSDHLVDQELFCDFDFDTIESPNL